MKIIYDMLYSLGLTSEQEFTPEKPLTFAPKVSEADSFVRDTWKSVVQSASKPGAQVPRTNIPKIEVVSSHCQTEPVLFFFGTPSILKVNSDFVSLSQANQVSILKGLEFAVETQNYDCGTPLIIYRQPPIFDHMRRDVRKPLVAKARTGGECVSSVEFRQWCKIQAEQPEPKLDFSN